MAGRQSPITIHYLLITIQPTNYKYIFLDLDDTIWDFQANAQEALRDVFYAEQLNGYFDSFETFFHLYSKRNLELWVDYARGNISREYLSIQRFLYPLQKVRMDDEKRALQMNNDFLALLGEKTLLVPYALELMNYCKSKNLPMTIVSNGFAEIQYRKLRSTNIEHYFAHIVLSDSADALKPDPVIFNYALDVNGASVEETLMIGDSYEADILGAANVGIDALFLNRSGKDYNFPEQVKEIKSLKEAIKLLGG